MSEKESTRVAGGRDIATGCQTRPCSRKAPGKAESCVEGGLAWSIDRHFAPIMSAAICARAGLFAPARPSSPVSSRAKRCAQSRTNASSRWPAPRKTSDLRHYRRRIPPHLFSCRLSRKTRPAFRSPMGNSSPNSVRTTAPKVGFKPPTMHVEAPIRHVAPIQGEDFDFLKAHTRQTPKVCIPAPSMLHFRGGRRGDQRDRLSRSRDILRRPDAAYRAEIADLAARGCRYLQLDDTNLAYLCDPAIRESTKGARR